MPANKPDEEPVTNPLLGNSEDIPAIGSDPEIAESFPSPPTVSTTSSDATSSGKYPSLAIKHSETVTDARALLLIINNRKLSVVKVGILSLLIQGFLLMTLLWLGQLRGAGILHNAPFTVLVSGAFVIDALTVLVFSYAWFRVEQQIGRIK